VVTSTIVLDGTGWVEEFVGGYDDWLRQAQPTPPPSPPPRPAEAKSRPAKERPRKLTFKETQELGLLPERIAALEEEQAGILATLADPEFYKGAGSEVARLNARLPEVEEELTLAYARWEELETLAESLKN
jgi:ATP-binding cassette subfamily F protein uup